MHWQGRTLSFPSGLKSRQKAVKLLVSRLNALTVDDQRAFQPVEATVIALSSCIVVVKPSHAGRNCRYVECPAKAWDRNMMKCLR